MYEWITKASFLEDLKGVVLNTMLHKDGVRLWSPPTLRDAVKNCVTALTVKELADPLYSAEIEPYLGIDTSFRKDYKYDVYVDSSVSALANPEANVTFHEDRYVCISEDIQYTRHCGKQYSHTVTVGFAYDPDTLERLMDKPHFLFREVMHLEPAEKNALTQCDDDTLKRFVLDNMSFKAYKHEDGEETQLEVSDIRHEIDTGVRVGFWVSLIVKPGIPQDRAIPPAWDDFVLVSKCHSLRIEVTSWFLCRIRLTTRRSVFGMTRRKLRTWTRMRSCLKGKVPKNHILIKLAGVYM